MGRDSVDEGEVDALDGRLTFRKERRREKTRLCEEDEWRSLE